MASKRHQRRKSCEGKKRFDNMPDAKRAAYNHERAFGAWMVAYGCRHCNGYHIGHPPRKVRMAINAKRAMKV